ncbi:MAP3K12-binding inhibitory protein 1-like isoform X1 [Metopolophium dirhodum]|uniref:MAP3K12-binding inhibitory protein 1-like isoform X1 n=1 Tax=Metopolophium dirhodum TaxID=44670 RepID=UPI00298FFF1F|nr:MAP3K12-binding inhibitory protein 1-like isoform X1 [Metopolophium dirhodum]
MEKGNEITFDSDEIQIYKPIAVVNRRIENFLKRKRDENQERNARLYCNSISSRNCSSASRTCNTIEAKRQKGSECFVKKTKVNNNLGPLNNGGLDPASLNSYNLSSNSNSIGLNPDVQERISNIETVLNIKSDGRSNIDIYDKLKSLEDHVLKLENILLNINENYSLSNTFSIDKDTGTIRHNLKTDDLIRQVNKKLACEDNMIKKEIKPSVLPKKSKYSANEIQELINNVKRIDEKKKKFLNQ